MNEYLYTIGLAVLSVATGGAAYLGWVAGINSKRNASFNKGFLAGHNVGARITREHFARIAERDSVGVERG